MLTVVAYYGMSDAPQSRLYVNTGMPQEQYTSTISYAGPLTPPPSAHESRRGSLACGSLLDGGYHGMSTGYALSQPATPVHHVPSLGLPFQQQQWRQLPDSPDPTANYSYQRPHGNHHASFSASSARGLDHGGFAQEQTSHDVRMDMGWQHAPEVPWTTSHPAVQTHHLGLSSSLFQSNSSLGQASNMAVVAQDESYTGLHIDTSQANSFTASITAPYPYGQATVVPSELSPSDQYIMQNYSAYSSPNGGRESLSNSFASASTSFESMNEYTTPPTPDDVYTCTADDEGWEHIVKGEHLSPTPGVYLAGHSLSSRDTRSRRTRRRPTKGSKANQPRETRYVGEQGIRVDLEGKACGSGLGWDLVNDRLVGPERTYVRKPHICPMMDDKTGRRCDAGFDRSEHLKRHMAKHSDARPYSCPLPDCKHTRGMGRGDNAKDHFKTHLKGTKTGRRNAHFKWPMVKAALLQQYTDEKTSTNLITNIERWIRTNKDGACQRNRYGEPLTESDLIDMEM